MIKAIRIGEDLNSFLREHPEIRIQKFNEKIIAITFPEDVIVNNLLISEGILYNLIYTYNGKTYSYSYE